MADAAGKLADAVALCFRTEPPLERFGLAQTEDPNIKDGSHTTAARIASHRRRRPVKVEACRGALPPLLLLLLRHGELCHAQQLPTRGTSR
eukprot:SAG31_NODE_573_length_13971_cov_5.931949_11_plen_91_part_00